MAEAIEAVIDPWLITNFTAEMGSGSAYASSKLETIGVAVLSLPKDWDGWALPALGISHRYGYLTPNSHPFTLDNTIIYRLTFVTYGIQTDAIAEGAKLFTRGIQALTAIKDNVNSLVNDDGMRVNEMIFYKSGRVPVDIGAYQMRKYADPKQAGKYFVAHDLNVAFIATTGV